MCSNVGSLCANNNNVTITICRQCTFHVNNSILNQHTLQWGNTLGCLFIGITEEEPTLITAQNDGMINSFNLVQLSAWRANVDMQYIVSRR